MTMIQPDTGTFNLDMLQLVRDDFDRLRVSDCFVAGALQAGLSESDALKLCVVATVRQNAELKQALEEALRIAPQRYELPDGRTMRWDAPDRLVPLKKLGRIPPIF